MLVYLGFAMGLVALVKGHQLVRKSRRRRVDTVRLRHLLHTRELRELDAHLDRIAEVELCRIEARVSRYVAAGLAGHVVVISESSYGIVLGLSDGHRLALGGINRSTLRVVRRRMASEKLRPARVERDSFSYRLLLRGDVGTDIELTTRRLALTS